MQENVKGISALSSQDSKNDVQNLKIGRTEYLSDLSKIKTSHHEKAKIIWVLSFKVDLQVRYPMKSHLGLPSV